MKRIIAIVAGGDSSEHDVSLRSAQGIYSFMNKDLYECYITEIKGQSWTVNLEDGTQLPILIKSGYNLVIPTIQRLNVIPLFHKFTFSIYQIEIPEIIHDSFFPLRKTVRYLTLPFSNVIVLAFSNSTLFLI